MKNTIVLPKGFSNLGKLYSGFHCECVRKMFQNLEKQNRLNQLEEPEDLLVQMVLSRGMNMNTIPFKGIQPKIDYKVGNLVCMKYLKRKSEVV